MVIRFLSTYGSMPHYAGKRADGHEKRLFEYVSGQRRSKRQGGLSRKEIDEMESIPDFRWTRDTRSFEESVTLLRAFHEKYGELPIHSGKRNNGDEARLAKFTNQQRVLYHKGELDEERIKAINSIEGFDWGQTLREFNDSVELVLDFLEKYGELPITGGKREDGDEARIGNFLVTQRYLYHRKELAKERIEGLEKITSFDWGQTNREFNDSMEVVLDFLKKHEELPIAGGKRDDGDEARIATFLTKQRFLYHRKELVDERIEALEKITSFDWGQTNREFNNSVELVFDFLETYGELPIIGGKRKDGDEDRLAQFLSRQRVYYRKGELTEMRIEALKNIPGFGWGGESSLK